MANEIEGKYPVSDHGPVRRALRREGATFLGTAIESDVFYDTPGGTYGERGCALRVRRVRVLRRGARPVSDRPMITFKGPVQPGAVKCREEIQTHFDSAGAGDALLRACGLVERCRIEKRRSTYRLGKATVTLDELPLLGRFVEIEGVSEVHVQRVRRRLGIASDHVRDSYLAMLIGYCRDHGLGPESMVFSSSDR